MHGGTSYIPMLVKSPNLDWPACATNAMNPTFNISYVSGLVPDSTTASTWHLTSMASNNSCSFVSSSIGGQPTSSCIIRTIFPKSPIAIGLDDSRLSSTTGQLFGHTQSPCAQSRHTLTYPAETWSVAGQVARAALNFASLLSPSLSTTTTPHVVAICGPLVLATICPCYAGCPAPLTRSR